MARVQLKNVEKTFNKNKVLKGINVEVPDGSFMVMVGPSGCGKSTALRCIAGLEEVTGGSIFIGDEDVTSKEPKDRNIAMVFQNYALYPHMNVFDNITYGLKVRGIPADERKRRAEDAAKLLGLDGLLDRMPKQLSGGQRQRVAMGRAIVREPSVFLFDEPLSNLDANLRNQMRIELRRLHQRQATTSIYVTHDQVEAMTLAEKILVLRAGNIEQYGTPDDIYLHPASVFVAQFMGSPSMNMIPATTDGEKLILPDGTPLSGVAASDIRLAAAPSRACSSACAAKTCCSIPKVPCSHRGHHRSARRTRWLLPSHRREGGRRRFRSERHHRASSGTRRPRPATPSASPSAPATATFDPASGLRCL
ncbi:MAG: ABC transporter ATP-binding protein [Bilophila wadsworthia]